MNKLIKILSTLGRIITTYSILLIIAMICLSFSYDINPNNHKRCTLRQENYDFSFLSQNDQINNYEIFFSCNTIDVIVYPKSENKEDCISLVIELSYFMPNYEDLRIVCKLENEDIIYFKIVEKGVVLAS